jgi:regulatory protein
MEYSLLLKKISNYCANRERNKQEVRNKLAGWGAEDSDIEHIINVLQTENLINEVRYATTFAEQKLINNHWGKNKIIQALESQNIEKNTIDKVIEGIQDEEYREIAHQVAARLMNNKNIYTRMLSQGFEEEIIADILVTQGYHDL